MSNIRKMTLKIPVSNLAGVDRDFISVPSNIYIYQGGCYAGGPGMLVEPKFAKIELVIGPLSETKNGGWNIIFVQGNKFRAMRHCFTEEFGWLPMFIVDALEKMGLNKYEDGGINGNWYEVDYRWEFE